jgi:Flp pilus assembly protein TadD
MPNAKGVELKKGASLAEILEIPAEVRELVASVAAAALDAGRVEEAEKVLEGLVAVHPREPIAWALLARAHRRTGKGLAARFAAEVARQLAPRDPEVLLSHAEVMLGEPDGRAAAVEALHALRSSPGPVGARAAALVAALGVGGGGARTPLSP